MRIDRNNYEVFFLDYFEGNLTADRVEELMTFLDGEADLKAEFDKFEMVSLTPNEPVVFENKGSLKRGAITIANHDWYFAAYVENDLSREEVAALEEFVAANPQMQRELNLMLQARLKPEPEVVFAGKDNLKRSKVVPLYVQLLRYGAAAAVIFLVATLFFISGPRPDAPGLAYITPTQTQEQPSQSESFEAPLSTPAETETANMTPAVVSRVLPVTTPPISETYVPELISVPPVLLASRMQARSSGPIELLPEAEAEFEPRTEFAYWHRRIVDPELIEIVGPPTVSFFQLAYQGIQRNLSGNAGSQGQSMTERNSNLLVDLVGASLLGLNDLLGSPVYIGSQRDENGRLIQVGIGNRIEITRK